MQLTLNREMAAHATWFPRIREAKLFRIGTGLIALHVVDDNFLQPEPDVSAGDHLISGLVPLGLLIFVTLLYPRLRAALRATLALLVGAMGLAMGLGEAGYYTVKVGPSGDDFSGLLAIPASVLLIGLGSVVLWRMRQFTDSKPRRYIRRSAYAFLGVLIAWTVVMPSGWIT